MIIGIGTDILKIVRIDKLLSLFANKFVKKVLSSLELQEYGEAKLKNLFIAKRFCAKESILKAFSIGMGRGVKLSDITIKHNKLGKPIVFLSKEANLFLSNFHQVDEEQIKIDVSISDEDLYVVAFSVFSI